jgi:hypothetical protein
VASVFTTDWGDGTLLPSRAMLCFRYKNILMLNSLEIGDPLILNSVTWHVEAESCRYPVYGFEADGEPSREIF